MLVEDEEGKLPIQEGDPGLSGPATRNPRDMDLALTNLDDTSCLIVETHELAFVQASLWKQQMCFIDSTAYSDNGIV